MFDRLVTCSYTLVCIKVQNSSLESPIKYTITFQNQQLKEFAVAGSISEKLSFLDENGYIVSEYGAKEALNSMITAFRDDG